jgi:hypothetical protein
MKMLWFVVVLIGSALKELAIAPFVRTPKIQGMGLRTQNIYLLTLLFLFELIALPIVNVLDALFESFRTEIPRSLRDYADFLLARRRERRDHKLTTRLLQRRRTK